MLRHDKLISQWLIWFPSLCPAMCYVSNIKCIQGSHLSPHPSYLWYLHILRPGSWQIKYWCQGQLRRRAGRESPTRGGQSRESLYVTFTLAFIQYQYSKTRSSSKTIDKLLFPLFYLVQSSRETLSTTCHHLNKGENRFSNSCILLKKI